MGCWRYRLSLNDSVCAGPFDECLHGPKCRIPCDGDSVMIVDSCIYHHFTYNLSNRFHMGLWVNPAFRSHEVLSTITCGILAHELFDTGETGAATWQSL